MTMSCNVTLDKRPKKFLEQLAKKSQNDFFQINGFLVEVLPNCENPCALPNAKHLKNFKDNRWRWRLGVWRVIGIVKDGKIFFIQVVKIARRNEKTYKGA